MDFNNFNQKYKSNVQVFKANCTVANTGTTIFKKPRSISLIHIFAWSGGGGGGGGFVGAANAASGGGGGGSGCAWQGMFHSTLFPDYLYLQIGVGGAGGGSAANGSDGVATAILIYPGGGTTQKLVALSGGTHGGAGTSSTGGSAGGAASATTLSSNGLSGFGNWLAIAGNAGVAGGANGAVGVNQALFTVSGAFLNGGSGGGGLPAASTVGKAGGIMAGTTAPYINQVASVGGAITPTAGGDGAPGFYPIQGLFVGYGGAGGASSGTSVSSGSNGGNGGRGAFGCGGGGGGAAFTAFTGGKGGAGGDGGVIITCW